MVFYLSRLLTKKSTFYTVYTKYFTGSKTVKGEFLLSKKIYANITGRELGNDVIAYQIRQSFKPAEVTPELANKTRYELALKFTKGNHVFL